MSSKLEVDAAKEHSGAHGMGVDYDDTMVHKNPGRVTHGPTLAPKSAA